MNLLLTNDDGYDSKGIEILFEKLSEKHNVFIIAPDRNRSAVSNHISIFENLKLEKVCERVWKYEGFPADCVSLGIFSDLIGTKIDAVLSGINYGQNLGSDIIYSGTCAGARQAVLAGIPGIALSLHPIDWEKAKIEGFKFDSLAEFVCNNLETLISLCELHSQRVFVNVNAGSFDFYKGAKITEKLCVRHYNEKIKVINDGNNFFTTYESSNGFTEKDENSDNELVHQQYIAISRVYCDPICNKIVDDVKFKL